MCQEAALHLWFACSLPRCPSYTCPVLAFSTLSVWSCVFVTLAGCGLCVCIVPYHQGLACGKLTAGSFLYYILQAACGWHEPHCILTLHQQDHHCQICHCPAVVRQRESWTASTCEYWLLLMHTFVSAHAQQHGSWDINEASTPPCILSWHLCGYRSLLLLMRRELRSAAEC
jgi:hypothetical protein